MKRRRITLSLAVAGIVTLLLAGVVTGQDPEDASDDPEATTETRSGTIESMTDAEGDTEYQLTDESGTVRLSVGPPWFWGEDHPLDGLSGTVTVTGEMDEGTPPADGQPSFDVFEVNGTVIRAAGKPPWAGGPAVVGESHPGYAGWSRGHANADESDDD